MTAAWRGPALAIFFIYRLTPQYTGSAQVLVGLQQVKLGTIQDVLSDLKGDNEMIATEIGIIRSRKLAEKTVTKLNLDNDPEFNPALQSPGLFANLLNSQCPSCPAAPFHPAGIAGRRRPNA